MARPQLSTSKTSQPETNRQLGEMLWRVGIDAGDPALSREIADIEPRCAVCGVKARCQAWLAAKLPGDGWRMFCPSAAALELLRTDQYGRR